MMPSWTNSIPEIRGSLRLICRCDTNENERRQQTLSDEFFVVNCLYFIMKG